MTDRPRRVTLVADELLGYVRTGGIGTATTHLALALARMGHDVEVLYSGEPPSAPLNGDWARSYGTAGVRIRVPERSEERVEPAYLARARDVERALRDEPPDVVITQDLAAPAYAALRKRQLGLGLEGTLFVVYCHGARRWISDMARKVRVLPGAHAVTVLEQASVELADVAVAPSAYVVDWMRGEGWDVPADTVVIPHLPRSAATGETVRRLEPTDRQPERIAFFGRLEERKGLRPFAAGVNALEPGLLKTVELVFVGAVTPAWPRERVLGLFSDDAKEALRGISFEASLDQPEALAYLSRDGTLAVMPSFGETFSNAVYECLERGIPFIASDAGAPRELVAADDRDVVLFEPTPDGVAGALRRALTRPLRSARLAFDAQAACGHWDEVIRREPKPRGSEHDDADHTLRVHNGDEPTAELLEQLRTAQAASGADVVTCGVRLPSGEARLFIGECGGLGALTNAYGTVGYVRRSLLEDAPADDWLLYARLALKGATIVSIPDVLVETRRAELDDPEVALAVAQEFELALPRATRSLARLAAGLDAQTKQSATPARRRFSTLLRR
jgi:glycosyltransferase involved in cell wall biosynthesis